MRISFLLLFFFFYVLIPLAFADLKFGFYGSTCPKAVSIIQQLVENRFNRDKSITAALVSLQFHDCFVRGCDASILINSTKKKPSEKSAGDSLFLRGFDLIDEIKENLEATCPSTVSCADIITLGTRDAVALIGGPKYQVPMGRRDGLVSNRDDVLIPTPDFSVSLVAKFFVAKGFTITEMVTLLGAHTIGVAHCGFFGDRLTGTESDPGMDPALKAKLNKLCSKPFKTEPTAFLDQNTLSVVDNEFYNQILKRRGILRFDQQLALDNTTSGIVRDFALDNVGFRERFAKAMMKMGSIEVLTGKEGEIRKNCNFFNNPN